MLDTVRVGFYGTGGFANRTHIPNLLSLPGVEIVALADASPEALANTAARLPTARTYTDAHEMLTHEKLDVLYSCVPAFARSDVEIAAARMGIHLFSEKPQALRMRLACEIDQAIAQAGVISTVGFRERYRPLFREARRLLADRAVVHVQFVQYRQLAHPRSGPQAWYDDVTKSGGAALDWGVHAMDLTRFTTGLDVVSAQAFYLQHELDPLPLCSSLHYCLTNGATMTLTMVTCLGQVAPKPSTQFKIFYEGGYLELFLYDRVELDGQVAFQAEPFDPWLEHDRLFIQAVRTGDHNLLDNDYHNGLSTLAPLLAGWESSRRGGQTIDVNEFMQE